jgi:hypothetical protein
VGPRQTFHGDDAFFERCVWWWVVIMWLSIYMFVFMVSTIARGLLATRLSPNSYYAELTANAYSMWALAAGDGHGSHMPVRSASARRPVMPAASLSVTGITAAAAAAVAAAVAAAATCAGLLYFLVLPASSHWSRWLTLSCCHTLWLARGSSGSGDG